jgi:hypothetical protein
MRSELVFGAMANVPNRYLLSQLASRAARKLHKAGTRMQETTNEVLVRFSRADPLGYDQALAKHAAVLLHPIIPRPVIPQKSKSDTFTPARENPNPLREAARVLGA